MVFDRTEKPKTDKRVTFSTMALFGNPMTAPNRVQQGYGPLPNQIELNSLNLSYPGWEDDVKIEMEAHMEGRDIRHRIPRLLEAQRVHDGNRSHWRLIELDFLDLSYPGWEVDVKEAERFHIRNGECILSDSAFSRMIMGLRSKQQLLNGDRSHPNLQRLDSLELNYPGWQDEFVSVEKDYQCGDYCFEQKLFVLEERQRMYDDDRSHPRLLELDRCSFNYPGWDGDLRKTEEAHLQQVVGSPTFETCLLSMKNKEQMIVMGLRSHPNLVRLDRLRFTYFDWETDFLAAEQAHQSGSQDKFESKFEILKVRQRVSWGRRSHPHLVQLDELELTYPGWQEDFQTAQQLHLSREITMSREILFERLVEKMKDEQTLHVGSGSPRLGSEGTRTTTNSGMQNHTPGTCIICMTNQSTHALVPCGHFCMCRKCTTKSMKRGIQCPLCRQRVTGSMKIFFS